MQRARPDVLAITPESLEAMFLSTRIPPAHMLGHVRAIVIDEVHAFASDDRGSHLVSLIERVTRLSGNDIQRVGLSATVGDPDDIVAWLGGSSMRPGRVVDPGGARRQSKLVLDHVGGLENAALLIDRMYPGTRRLVFVDSRRGVEKLGHTLGQRGVDVYLSHSSLALSERSAAEAAFTEGSNCTFLCAEDDAVLQAAGLLELHDRGYVEPADPSRWAPHVLAQQLIALAMQERGVPSLDWWDWLEGCAAFSEIAATDRAAVANHMLAEGILDPRGAARAG